MIGFSSIDEVWDTQGFVSVKKENVSKPKTKEYNEPVKTEPSIRPPVMSNSGYHSVNINDSTVVSKLSNMSKTEQTSYIQKLIRKDAQMGDSFVPDMTDIDLFIKIFIALIVFEFLKTLLFPSQTQE